MHTFFFLVFYCCSLLAMDLSEETPLIQKNDYMVINVSTPPSLPNEIVQHINSFLRVGNSKWCVLASHYGMSESEETIITQRLLNGLVQESENYTDLKKRIKNLKAFKKCKHGPNSVNEQLKTAVSTKIKTDLTPYIQNISLFSRSNKRNLLGLLNELATTITQKSRIDNNNFHTPKTKIKTYCGSDHEVKQKYTLSDDFKNNFKNYLSARSDKKLTQWYVEMKKYTLYLDHCNAITKRNNAINDWAFKVSAGSMPFLCSIPLFTGFATANLKLVGGSILLGIGQFLLVATIACITTRPGMKNSYKLKCITHQWKKMFKNIVQLIEDEKKTRIV